MLIFRIYRKLVGKIIKDESIREKYNIYLTSKYISKKKYYNCLDTLDKMTENKTIWFCWFQGIENAPDIVKKCYDRLASIKDYKVIVISDDNFLNYVTIPDYILEKYKNGIISRTHFLDILRIELLAQNGGIWIDSTVLFTGNKIPEYIENSDLFFFREVNLNNNLYAPIKGSSWLIKANKNNKIIVETKNMIENYWKNNNVLIHYFLFHICFGIVLDNNSDIFNKMENYNNVNPHIMQYELSKKYNKTRWDYYKTISDFHILTYKFKEIPNSESNYQYIIDKE